MNRTLYLVLIYVHSGKKELLRRYEQHALPIMRKHGGAFERVMTPVAAASAGDTPDEIHLLSFETEGGFTSFRADPDMENLRALREEVVKQAIVIKASNVPLETYFSDEQPDSCYSRT